MRRVTLAAITLAVAVIAGILTGTQPAWGHHGNIQALQHDQRKVRITSLGYMDVYTSQGPTWFDNCQFRVAGGGNYGQWKIGVYFYERATGNYVDFELVNYLIGSEYSQYRSFDVNAQRDREPYYELSIYYRPNANYNWVWQGTFNVDPFQLRSDEITQSWPLHTIC